VSHRAQPGTPAGAQHAAAAVQDRDAQVAQHPAGVIQAAPVPVQAAECFLDDILGTFLIADQQERHADETDSVMPVQIGDGVHSGQLLLRAHRGDARVHAHKTSRSSGC